MASKSLDDLDPRFKPIAMQLIFDCKAKGVNLTIITTLRSIEEQKQAVAHGVSWTMNSKHLPQPPDGKSLAMDVCPTDLLSTKNWAPLHPYWWTVAEAAVKLGLRSGMDWHGVGLPPLGQARAQWDPGHVEFVVK